MPDTPALREALRLLGTFVTLVREKDPATAEKLTGLALQWAARQDISVALLLETLAAADRIGG
jgi:hypothetical protein